MIAYLTFDDGPDGPNTEAVLDVLRARGAHATFFLVGERIRGQEAVVRRIVDEGHAIGNHSWDHRYRNYLRSSRTLKQWIESANREFERLQLPESVGFRPPAGVVTPRLKRVLREMNEPLVLWHERFYDAVREWTPAKARRSAERLKGGSVVLLHDRQRAGREQRFRATLELYIDQLRERGFKFEPLTRSICERGCLGQPST